MRRAVLALCGVSDATFLAALAAVPLLAGCVKETVLPSPTDQATSKLPLVLRLPKHPGGQPFDIASERGNVVLLDVWATWCEPCRDALPVYEALAKQYGSRGFKVYAINVDTDAPHIAAFLASLKVQVPVLIDKDGAFAEQMLHVTQMPTTFLLDRKGVVRQLHEGFAEEFLQLYQTEIEALLAEPAK